MTRTCKGGRPFLFVQIRFVAFKRYVGRRSYAISVRSSRSMCESVRSFRAERRVRVLNNSSERLLLPSEQTKRNPLSLIRLFPDKDGGRLGR